MNLTDNELRIKIAEFCGWRNCRMSRGRPFWGDDEGQCKYNALCGSPSGEALSYIEELPNYLESLDAIFEAEECLTEQQLEKMFGIMCDKLADEEVDGIDPKRKLIFHSDARFRAMCFLETIK